MRSVVRAVAVSAALALATAVPATAASAAGQVIGHIAYVSGGNIWLDGRQLTHDGNDDWPRIRPGGDAVVYNHGTQLWLVATAAGSAPHLLVDTGVVGRPAWSPTGDRLAYIADGAEGTGIFIAHYAAGALSGAAFVTWAGPFGTTNTGWAALLRQTNALAWSPDGTWLAFAGGECLGMFDYCVSQYNLTTGDTYGILDFSGSGGEVHEGFANIPAFSADSATFYLSTQFDDPIHHNWELGPLHVASCPAGGNCYFDYQVQVGRDGDTVASPSPLTGTATILVTAAHNGQAWVTRVRADGSRTYLYQGYGQDWVA